MGQTMGLIVVILCNDQVPGYISTNADFIHPSNNPSLPEVSHETVEN